jgi:hypothetical protein
MATLDYNYSPNYGVEDYAEVNGLDGAKVSQDNLCITLWEIDGGAFAPPFAFGNLIVPNYINDAVPEQNRAAFKQGMKSRTSCLSFLVPSNDPKLTNDLCLVLNPPPEYRQQMAQAVVFNGGDPLDLANYTISKSLQGNYTWRPTYQLTTGIGDENIIDFSPVSPVIFSTYLQLDPVDAAPLPFLKTNGADGVAPVFFDRTTAGGVAEMIAAVNGGEFYIAMAFADLGVGGTGKHFGAVWPHSAARG